MSARRIVKRSREDLGSRRGWVVAALVTCLTCTASIIRAAEVTETEIENRRCLNCHGQSHIATLSPKDRQPMVVATTQPSTQPVVERRASLFVPGTLLGSSVHAKIACTDCHAGAQTLPHPQELGPATCNTTSCHTKPQSDFLQGVHADALAKSDPNAPTCVNCHGTHDIFPSSQRDSHTYPLNIVKICGDCHQKHQSTATNGIDGKLHVEHYLDSVHGRAVTRGGLAVAATCADCHGNHRVLPASDPQSQVSRGKVDDTCGACHVGVSETFATSVHGQQLAKGNELAPVCSDCHTAHQITRTDTPSFMLDIVNECGSCHDDPALTGTRKASLLETYRRSYHGQVTELGSTRAARCSDCHGAHNVEATDAISEQERVGMCRSCHAEATASFAKFQPHADFHDPERYPILHGVWLYFVVMMSFAFGFFGLHSLLWLGRSIIERVKHGPHPKINHHGPAIRRFNRVDRVNHAFVIISFFGLTLTGLPLLYADQGWAKTLAAMLGGVRSCGVLHRIFAVMLILNFVVHFVGLARRLREMGLKKMLFGPTTMLPRWKDVTDCFSMFRWFFRGGKKPKFDRWTYWEKFDYVAEVGGSMIIGVTGLLLWFPQFFATFLPGWMFNVATVVHGYEALLAIGFIFTIHFFNAHLRLEKFPVDDVMFTGRLPEEEFKEERGVEYERLVASGELEKLRVAPAPRWYRVAAVTAGILAMAVGTTLVVLIILAGLKLL